MVNLLGLMLMDGCSWPDAHDAHLLMTRICS